MENDLCVLVHGFTGSPEELEPLARALRDEGYTVALPVLYGHGQDKDALRSATASHWIHSVQPYVETGLTRGRVHLIGFSMGAMVCAVLAGKYPVASVTMLSPAIFYASPKHVFRQIADIIKDTWDARGMDAAYVRRRVEKMSNTPLVSLKQFRRMVQLGKAALPQVVVPLCVIHGEQDDIVESRSAAYACTQAGSNYKELHYLPYSTHLICHGPEADTVNALVVNFLRHVDELDAAPGVSPGADDDA